ncbi:ankyrin repeat domain-containing protein [Legionella sp. CNM-1927-20]|uniref:ankyrin repeat domain-containing protein n=1 Tax=Legionella sp. CNM-1927-20 TaxID=3422221 RepID=UPI00403AA41C
MYTKSDSEDEVKKLDSPSDIFSDTNEADDSIDSADSEAEQDEDDYDSDINEGAIEAARNGDVKYLEELLANNILLLDLRDHYGNTLLHLAIMNEDVVVVKFLLENGALVNVVNGAGAYPLHFAARRGNLDLVNLLIAYEANIDCVNKMQESPLYTATLFQHREVVNALLEKRANPNHRNKELRTPLHVASIQGDEEIIALLIQHKAIVDAQDEKNFTPIHEAIMNGHNNIVQKLKRSGSQIDSAQFLLDRDLSIIFNNDLLYKFLEEIHGLDLSHGGNSKEAVRIIQNGIRQFLDECPEYQIYFESILKALEAFDSDESTILEPPEADCSIKSLSSLFHISYILIKKSQDTYFIYFCDRGLLGFKGTKSDKAQPIIQLSIPAADYSEVMRKLSSICESGELDRLFVYIFELKQKYKSTGINLTEQAVFKNGNCYFENLKTLLLCELINIDNKLGKGVYKKFDLFMHESILADYQRRVNNYNNNASDRNKVVFLCKEILASKYQKLKGYENTVFQPKDSNMKRKEMEASDEPSRDKKARKVNISTGFR